jgi:hypothetical protein
VQSSVVHAAPGDSRDGRPLQDRFSPSSHPTAAVLAPDPKAGSEVEPAGTLATDPDVVGPIAVGLVPALPGPLHSGHQFGEGLDDPASIAGPLKHQHAVTPRPGW